MPCSLKLEEEELSYSPRRSASLFVRQYVTAHRFKPLLERTGLPQIRFDDLRTTCSTLLLSKNVNAKVLSEILGHATIAITPDTYSHVLPTPLYLRCFSLGPAVPQLLIRVFLERQLDLEKIHAPDAERCHDKTP
jgi:Phage integrase family